MGFNSYPFLETVTTREVSQQFEPNLAGCYMKTTYVGDLIIEISTYYQLKRDAYNIFVHIMTRGFCTPNEVTQIDDWY